LQIILLYGNMFIYCINAHFNDFKALVLHLMQKEKERQAVLFLFSFLRFLHSLPIYKAIEVVCQKHYKAKYHWDIRWIFN
jgi:hypothetical protein